MGETPLNLSKQQAVAKTLCEELQVSNCIYKSQSAPAKGIEATLRHSWGKLLTSIGSMLTLPKLHLPTKHH